MKTLNKTLLATAISGLALSSAVSVQAESFDSLYKDGSMDISFRYRVESNDVDNTKDAALANTLKSRITFKSGAVYGVSALVEGDNVLHITDDFDDKSPDGDTEHNVVLDQETTQLNQAYLQYAMEGTTVKLGNQRILLDNQRHVGGVGFRQDEATFDALSVKSDIAGATVFAAFANNLNNIKDEDVEQDMTLVNVKYPVTKEISATAFYYDIEDTNGDSLSTTGLRSVGSAAGFGFEAEVATQSNSVTSDSPLYVHLAGSKKISGVKATLGYESFGGDDNLAFGTSLGTNHKFLGWTDTYLQAPTADGITDIYASAVTTVAGVKVVGQYHNFSTSEGSDDLGSEFGFLVAKKFGTYGVSLKASQFLTSDFAENLLKPKKDTTKIWLTGTAKF